MCGLGLELEDIRIGLEEAFARRVLEEMFSLLKGRERGGGKIKNLLGFCTEVPVSVCC